MDKYCTLIAANRDEMTGRPWLPPARHWPDRQEVVAGIDQLAGGSWLGMNDTGVVAAILNRVGTLGPEPGKRSRGELVLEALDHADAIDAVNALRDLNGKAYRPFNMVVADNRDAFWLKNDEFGRISVFAIEPGTHILTAHDLDSPLSPRARKYLPKFQAATRPRPEADEWQEWEALLADNGSEPGPEDQEDAAMCFLRDTGFGTQSAALIALPRIGVEDKAIFRFCDTPPNRGEFYHVASKPQT